MTKVYIDADGLIYDASLNQTNIGKNNNKVLIHLSTLCPLSMEMALTLNSSIGCS